MNIPNTNPVKHSTCAKCHAEFIPESAEQLKCYNCQTMEDMVKKHKQLKKAALEKR